MQQAWRRTPQGRSCGWRCVLPAGLARGGQSLHLWRPELRLLLLARPVWRGEGAFWGLSQLPMQAGIVRMALRRGLLGCWAMSCGMCMGPLLLRGSASWASRNCGLLPTGLLGSRVGPSLARWLATAGLLLRRCLLHLCQDSPS